MAYFAPAPSLHPKGTNVSLPPPLAIHQGSEKSLTTILLTYEVIRHSNI